MLLSKLLYPALTNSLCLRAHSDELRARVSGRHAAKTVLHAALAGTSGTGDASVYTWAMELKLTHSAQRGLIEWVLTCF